MEVGGGATTFDYAPTSKRSRDEVPFSQPRSVGPGPGTEFRQGGHAHGGFDADVRSAHPNVEDSNSHASFETVNGVSRQRGRSSLAPECQPLGERDLKGAVLRFAKLMKLEDLDLQRRVRTCSHLLAIDLLLQGFDFTAHAAFLNNHLDTWGLRKVSQREAQMRMEVISRPPWNQMVRHGCCVGALLTATCVQYFFIHPTSLFAEPGVTHFEGTSLCHKAHVQEMLARGYIPVTFKNLPENAGLDFLPRNLRMDERWVDGLPPDGHPMWQHCGPRDQPRSGASNGPATPQPSVTLPDVLPPCGRSQQTRTPAQQVVLWMESAVEVDGVGGSKVSYSPMKDWDKALRKEKSTVWTENIKQELIKRCKIYIYLRKLLGVSPDQNSDNYTKLRDKACKQVSKEMRQVAAKQHLDYTDWAREVASEYLDSEEL